ncbi:MAG: HlyD family efflux transporter periplasmic adaptor subunit [Salinarimonadaceae bacterium]|nr:MAG: HlyD family efflux transporter periplasmic adaptor subunit [Salinarimonadaceae bacterium]
MKYGRLIFGAIIAVVALWIIVGEQLSGASADAFVNARLSTLRAPVAGVLSVPERELGAQVVRGEELAQVSDRLVDSVRLDDLLLEEGLFAAEANRLAALRADTEAAIEELSARAERYGSERTAELELRLVHARARLGLLDGGAVEGEVEQLLDEGQSGDPGDSRVTGISLEYARERVGALEIALRAARAGAYLGDGYNDAPHSEQRLTELRSELAETGAAFEAAEARLVALRDRLDRERLRVNRFVGAALSATVDGTIWETLAADGETVQRGQEVLRLVNCGSVIVTLSVTESVYNRLSIGDAAMFRFTGDSRRFDGSVIRLAGSGAQTIYDNLAVAPSERHLERYDVALLAPGLRDDPEGCAVGRTGRVFFEARPLDRLRDMFAW